MRRGTDGDAGEQRRSHRPNPPSSCERRTWGKGNGVEGKRREQRRTRVEPASPRCPRSLHGCDDDEGCCWWKSSVDDDLLHNDDDDAGSIAGEKRGENEMDETHEREIDGHIGF
jgi:hypothetical protein